MMRLCTALILILALYQVDSSDRLKVFGNLHETSSLPCNETCSGLLTWTTFHKQDDVLVRCSRDSCWSKVGFSLPLERFLSGDSTLMVLRADYSLRGLYMAKCDSDTLCEVVFTLSPLEMSRVITPGEPIDVPLPLTDQVEVDFTPSDAEQPPNLQICIVDINKTHCSPDYRERSSLLSTLQIKDGNFSDSGMYTVRDTVNDEILVNLQINVEGSKAEQQGDGGVSQSHSVRRRSVHSVCNQERSMPVWASALIAVLVILLIISVLVNFYQWRVILRRGPADTTQQKTENTNRHQQNGENGPNPNVENSAHTPLTEQQQH